MSPPAHLSIPAPRSPGDDCPPSTASPPPAGAMSLLAQARSCLRAAASADRPTERCVFAHLAALRAATAMLVARSWRRDRGRPASVWTQLAEVAPELREWSAHFAAGSLRRAAAEAGSPRVTAGEAETALRHATEFVEVVERDLAGAAR